MSEIHKYANLIKKNTQYAWKMRTLSKKIFGEVIQDTEIDAVKKSMICVNRFAEEPPHKQPLFINYYPRHTELGNLMKKLRNYGLYRDEHEDFKEEFARLSILRGKMPYGSKKKQDRALIETK